MAPELDEDKQTGLPNPDQPEWYDQTLKDIQSLPETDEPQTEENATGPSVAEREAGIATSDGNQSATTSNEQDLQANAEGSGLYKGKGKKSARWTKERKIYLASGLGVGTLLIAFIPLLAPLKLVQFGQLLRQTHFFQNENLGNDRSSKLTSLYRYATTGAIQNTRLSAASGRIADKWDVRLANEAGVRPVYDSATGRMRGFEVVDADKAADLIQRFEADGVDTNASPENLNTGRAGDGTPSGRIISLADASTKQRRVAINTVVDSLDHNKVSAYVGSRKLQALGGVDFHPLKNLSRTAGEKFVDFKRRREIEHRERITSGVTDTDVARARGDTETTEDGETRDKTITVGDEQVSSSGNANDTNAILDAAKNPDADIDAIKKSILQRVTRSGAAAVAVVSIMCAVRDIGDQASDQYFQNTYLIPMRVGFEGISIAAQLLTLQDVTLDEIAYFWDLMQDDETGADAFSAAAVQSANGVPPTGPDLSDDLKPSEDGGKPLVFQILDNIPLLGRACGLQEGIFGFIGSIPIVGSVVDLASEIQGKAINYVLEGATGRTLEDIIVSVINFIAGGAANAVPEGPPRGNVSMYGTLYAANTLFLSSGGRILSDAETAELEEFQQQTIVAETRESSIFARLFDVAKPQSLASSVIKELPSNQKQLAQKVESIALNPISYLGEGILNTISPKTYAQAEAYSYGVPRVGFSVDEITNDLIQDPYENAAIVESDFTRLNDAYGKCFPSKLSDAGGSMRLEVPSFTENPVNQFTQDSSCRTENMTSQQRTDFLRYRMYLYDTVTIKSLSCYEGDSAACQEIAFGGPAPTSTPGISGTALGIEGLNGYAIPCQGQPTAVNIDRSGGTTRSVWDSLPNSGSIGTGTSGKPINVYIREACDTSNPRTVLIVSSIHGSENGGQLIAHELLYNEQLPPDVRLVVVPELNKFGIEYRVANGSGGRVNGNGVNLNRNNDYRWATMNGITDNTSPTSTNYRGTAPNSEPETVAIQRFILALGDIDLSLHYHDDINYVASAGNPEAIAIAERYARGAGMPFGNDGDPSIDIDGVPQVDQRGSLDGWQGSSTGQKVLLIELDADQSPAVIARHVETLKSIFSSDLMR